MNGLKTAALIASILFTAPALAETPVAFGKAALALGAAKAGYLLPNLRTRVKIADYLEAFAKFDKATPTGYQIYGADADLQSGLKFVIYRPLDRQGDAPWVLAITGTETLIDWLNNMDLGKPQFLGLNKIVTLFTAGFVPDKELIVTGHSLGGALAQAAAHEIQRVRNEKGLNHKKITLITWNGFGAQELINKFGSYASSVAGQIDIANYFIRGDVVSQIGRHFGPAYELVPPALSADSRLDAVLELHSLELFQKILPTTAFAEATPTSPPFGKALNMLSEVSGLIARLNRQIHEFRQLWLVRWICSMLDQVKTGEQLEIHETAYTYLYNVGFTEEIRLFKEKHPDKARDYVRLKESLARFLKLKMGTKPTE